MIMVLALGVLFPLCHLTFAYFLKKQLSKRESVIRLKTYDLDLSKKFVRKVLKSVLVAPEMGIVAMRWPNLRVCIIHHKPERRTEILLQYLERKLIANGPDIEQFLKYTFQRKIWNTFKGQYYEDSYLFDERLLFGFQTGIQMGIERNVFKNPTRID